MTVLEVSSSGFLRISDTRHRVLGTAQWIFYSRNCGYHARANVTGVSSISFASCLFGSRHSRHSEDSSVIISPEREMRIVKAIGTGFEVEVSLSLSLSLCCSLQTSLSFSTTSMLRRAEDRWLIHVDRQGNLWRWLAHPDSNILGLQLHSSSSDAEMC